MTQINLHTKERLILVEVPEDATDFKTGFQFIECSIDGKINQTYSQVAGYENATILGLFYPSRNEIDFEVNPSWMSATELAFETQVRTVDYTEPLIKKLIKSKFIIKLHSHTPSSAAEKYLVLIQK